MLQKMLDGSHLCRLPLEWQRKIHNEFQVKLQLCISDQDRIKQVADLTWQSLVNGVESREWLSMQLQPHLNQYAGDFADWVLDFTGKALAHFQSLDSLFCQPSPSISTSDGIIASQPSPLQNSNSIISEQNTESDIGCSSMGSSQQQSTSTAEMGGPFGAHNQGGFNSSNRNGSFWPQGPDGLSNTSSGFGTSCVYQADEMHADDKDVAIDPLDETLDNLILRQRINRIQGRGGTLLGVTCRSKKFSSNEVTNEAAPLVVLSQASSQSEGHHASAGSCSPFGTGAPPSRLPSNKVSKVPVTCTKYPNCEFGDSCRYIHPSDAICKHWPKCAFGPKCAYKHPHVPCRFNKNCTNPKCNYEHSS